MTRTDAIEALAALTRYAHTLERRDAARHPDEREAAVQALEGRDAARCAEALEVRCLVAGRRVPWSGVLLFATVERVAAARGAGHGELVRAAIARAAAVALPDEPAR